MFQSLLMRERKEEIISNVTSGVFSKTSTRDSTPTHEHKVIRFKFTVAIDSRF